MSNGTIEIVFNNSISGVLSSAAHFEVSCCNSFQPTDETLLRDPTLISFSYFEGYIKYYLQIKRTYEVIKQAEKLLNIS